MNKIPKLLYSILTIALFLGCSPQPPSVHNAKSIDRLRADETSIKARSLQDYDIPALGKYENLWRLDFASGWGSFDAQITDQGVAELCKLPFTHLENLGFGYCYNLTDESLKSLGNKKWSKLSLLMLGSCPLITDTGIPYLAKINTLEWLSLAGNTQLTGESLGALAEMPNLGTLDLRGCTNISDVGLKALKKLKNIERIELGGCTSISDDELHELRQALPNCYVAKDDALWARQ